MRAAVEGIALSVYDVIEEMSKAIGGWITNIKADGGLTQNSFLMQFQADILDVPLYSPSNQETTAYGTALLAGIARDVFPKKLEELRRYYKVEKMYRPQMEEHVRLQIINEWRRAVSRSRN